ncbi:MAG: NEW3 domain-containing protein [Candidatus Aenigmatarchaeota archaeon]
MKIYTIAIFLSTFLLILPVISFAGNNDKWKTCCSSGCDYSPSCTPIIFSFGSFYCCNLGWSTSLCEGCGCVRANPIVTVSPSSQTGSPGQTLTYTLNIMNQDNSACTASTFEFSVINCPSGWSCSSGGAIIPPSSSSSFTLHITSSPSAVEGTYSLTAKVTNSGNTSYYSLASANYVVKSTTTTITTTKPPTTTTTTPPTTTTTTTFPTATTCNNNNICDSGETQNNCPTDCKTVVTIEPYLSYPGQTVTITVYFNDSRFDITKDAKIDLWIDDQYWDPSYCPINGKKWRGDMKYGGGEWTCFDKMCSKNYDGKKVTIKTERGYGYLQTECKIPTNLVAGKHKLKSSPTIYSIPITLRAAETEIVIVDGLYNFVIGIKKIFSYFTGLFILQ